MLEEFKKFAIKGNVIDLAVGVIIGAAFGKITNSLVADVIMPPIGLLLGKIDFTNLFISLDGKAYATLADAKAAAAPTLNYGVFLQTILDFVLVAFAVFLLVKQVTRFRRTEEAAAPPAPETQDCPMCTKAIPVKAKRCPECTEVLTAAA